MIWALILFWLSVALLFYTYIGFVLILALRSVLFSTPYYRDPEYTPEVSMIIAAYNEASSIRDKLENILSLNYPSDKFEAIIASDGSDDGTNEIVAEYEGDLIKLLELPRQGKADALNEAVKQASGEVLVFSDANSIYAEDAIRNLVSPFADSDVGGVAGDQRYLSAKENSADNTGERSYWSLDRKLKEWESSAGNAISATGAIYAIRKSLFQEVPTGVTDDFTTSTRVIMQGYRLVFVNDAIAYEPVAKSQGREFQRKVRVMTRGLQSVIVNRKLLNPFEYGFYAIQLFSHKVLRRLMYIPFVILFVVNFFLWDVGIFYQLTMLGQLFFYGTALAGWLLARKNIKIPKILALPMYMCMVYTAALLASWNIIRGHRIGRWATVRS